MTDASATRPLTDQERHLAEWMLVHGSPDAARYIEQLDRTEATRWQCPCGCASINFAVSGPPIVPADAFVLGDYLVGESDDVFGIFIFQAEGWLAGIEVYGLANDAPKTLPAPAMLHKAHFGGPAAAHTTTDPQASPP